MIAISCLGCKVQVIRLGKTWVCARTFSTSSQARREHWFDIRKSAIFAPLIRYKKTRITASPIGEQVNCHVFLFGGKKTLGT
jgi:hypothetical protein